jgi:hypothetical protein
VTPVDSHPQAFYICGGNALHQAPETAFREAQTNLIKTASVFLSIFHFTVRATFSTACSLLCDAGRLV